jgi:quercetin dioxygenase-like cupin family protein
VKVEAGHGMVADASGIEHPLQTGDYIYIDDNEEHHLRNTGTDPFDFICIVPRRGEG